MEVYKNFSILSWNIRGAFGKVSRRHVRDLVNLHHPSMFFLYETHEAFDKVAKLWLSWVTNPSSCKKLEDTPVEFGFYLVVMILPLHWLILLSKLLLLLLRKEMFLGSALLSTLLLFLLLAVFYGMSLVN